VFFLGRIWNALFAAGVCAYSFFVAENGYAGFGYAQPAEVVLLSLGILFLVAFANAHNDIVDFEIDKINRKSRPLPSGKISLKAAWAAAGTWLCLSIIFGAVAGVEFALLFAVAGAFCFVYNRFLKGLPLIGNLAVALLTTVPIAVAIIKFGFPQQRLLLLAFFAFMLTLAREITKDIEDIAGDASLGLKTLPILWGENYSLAIVYACHLQCLAVLALFEPALLFAVVPCLAFSVFFACKKKWRFSQMAIKITMLVGLAAFAIC
jgi:4-hydroxybenzoate polyprenyltransferase